MAQDSGAMRYGFGKNWQRFLDRYADAGRIEIARVKLLENLALPDLNGRVFLDVGCGSGIHSLAAWQSGAQRVLSFDYDPDSVEATRQLHRSVGAPANWTICRGSVLEPDFLAAFGPVDIVYSWGVLHHTGAQWQAIENVCRLVRPGGLLSIALYAAEAQVDPPPEFWLKVKQAYNRKGALGRWRMELAHIWYIALKRDLRKLPALWRQAREYRKLRGMALYIDVRNWLGGWPMEFSTTTEVRALCSGRFGLALTRLKTGESVYEYLFRRPSGDAEGLAPLSFRAVESVEDLAALGGFFLFGTGNASRRLLAAARAAGLKILGVYDSSRTGLWEGFEITPASAAGSAPDTPVVVASSYFGDILHRLTDFGCRNIVDGFPLVAELMRADFARQGTPEQRYPLLLG